ncbi:unnamed protein product [Cylindrotheca closterium]|uniref:Proteasome alpha-type subunits domain-containing protein n=1 Tax=Cylindrotheca closterium TaxID=2856 RepID=A0AAD2FYP3_9STRA|nr:unnamed protein product [Cylindrotheca closterium]
MLSSNTLQLFKAFFLMIVSSASFFHASASSNMNYNAYNYDMTTPQFTPDGRLLQVEYASAASDRSSPLVALQINSTWIVLLTVSQSNTQNRITLFQDNPTSPFHPKSGNKESPIAIAMSGVLADNLSLLQKVLEEAANTYLKFQKEMSVVQAAKTIADACQQHAFGGGMRPYGSTMLVCGFGGGGGGGGSDNNNKQPLLFQTEPSGAIFDAGRTAAKSKSIASVQYIIGGSSATQRQLRKKLDQTLERMKKSDIAVGDVIAAASKILLKETGKNSKESGDNEKAISPPSLEVVVLSATEGCYRVTPEQLEAILA